MSTPSAKHTPAAKPTPGPWEADKWAPGFSVSAPESHYTICNLADCNNAEANARLIAAAPELLEACKVALRDIERLYIDQLQASFEGNAAVKTLRAAIARAEGVQS